MLLAQGMKLMATSRLSSCSARSLRLSNFIERTSTLRCSFGWERVCISARGGENSGTEGSAALDPIAPALRMDLAKSRADRFCRILAISVARDVLWVHVGSRIARRRADFDRFSEMAGNWRTGWWMVQSTTNCSPGCRRFMPCGGL